MLPGLPERGFVWRDVAVGSHAAIGQTGRDGVSIRLEADRLPCWVRPASHTEEDQKRVIRKFFAYSPLREFFGSRLGFVSQNRCCLLPIVAGWSVVTSAQSISTAPCSDITRRGARQGAVESEHAGRQ